MQGIQIEKRPHVGNRCRTEAPELNPQPRPGRKEGEGEGEGAGGGGRQREEGGGRERTEEKQGVGSGGKRGRGERRNRNISPNSSRTWLMVSICWSAYYKTQLPATLPDPLNSAPTSEPKTQGMGPGIWTTGLPHLSQKRLLGVFCFPPSKCYDIIIS